MRKLSFWLAVFFIWLVMLGCAVLTRPAAPTREAGQAIPTSVAATIQVSGTKPVQAPEPTPAAPVAQTPGTTRSPGTTQSSQTPQGVLPAPSSLAVAYIGPSKDIWIWKPGESPRKLTSSGDVASLRMSGDGVWIAFTRTMDMLHYSLWVTASDGSSQRELMSKDDFAALPHPAEAVAVMPDKLGWLPGNHLLAFNTRPALEGPGLILNDDLWIADIDGGSRKQVLAAGSGGQFVFSPDGARVALSKADSVSLASQDGSKRQEGVLRYERVSTYSEYAFYAVPVWSADAQSLAVVIPPPAALDRPKDPSVVWRIPGDGSAPAALGNFVTLPLINPVLAPNLDRLAYLSPVGAAEENRRELHLAGLDGSGDTLYQEGQYLEFQAWSPDAAHFIFSNGEMGQMVIGAVGDAPVPVVTERWHVNHVRWVDNNRFLYLANTGANLELRLRSLAGEDILIASQPGDPYPFIDYDFCGS